MTPSFALLLDQDAITLLHDVGGGWRRVGSVAFEAPDLADGLKELRARAAELAGDAPVRSTLVLPDSQILYTETAAGTDATDNAHRAAKRLDGATPYTLEELAFDWKTRGGEIRIAAVARETLDEAEAFALRHGFGPTCFTAAPEPRLFPGAPFFGPCHAAGHLLVPGEVLERPAAPILSQGDLDPPAPEREEPRATSGPEETTPEAQAAATPDAETGESPAANTAAPDIPTAPPAAQGAPMPEGVSLGPVLEAEVAPEEDVADLAPSTGTLADTAEAAVGEIATETPDTTPKPPEPESEDAVAPDASTTAEELQPGRPPAFASIRTRIEPRVTSASPPTPTRSGRTPLGDAEPSARDDRATRRKETVRTLRKENHSRIEPVVSARPAAPVSPKPAAPAAPATPPVPSSVAENAAVAPARAVRPTVSTSMKEAEALTVFGARKAQRTARAPLRPEVLAATAGIAAIALVGLWSLVGGSTDEVTTRPAPIGLATDAPVAFGRVPGVADVAVDSTEEAGAPEAIVLPQQDTPPEPDAVASVPDVPEVSASAEEPLLDSAEDEASAPPTPGTATAGTDSLDVAAFGTRTPADGDAASAAESDPAETSAEPDPVVEDLTEPEVASAAETVGVTPGPADDEQLALLTPEESSPAPGASGIAGTAATADQPDPVSARAAYAISGIWQVAPEPGLVPKTDDLEDIYIASIDPTLLNPDAYSLPDPRALPEEAPRAAEPPVVAEPEPEVTPEGEAAAPGGVAIRLGPPDVVPPVRPDGLAPEPPATAAETSPEVDIPPQDERLRGFRPRSRPEGLVEETERTNLGGRTLSELALVRPAPRPASAQETAEALAEAQSMADAETEAGQQATLLGGEEASVSPEATALAVDLATATSRAVAQSPEPRLRPANIAQIADRAQRRAEQEAQAQAEAERVAAEVAEAAEIATARDRAEAARAAQAQAAEDAKARAAAQAQAEAAAKAAAVAEAAAAAKAAEEAEAEEAAARSSGPAVPRRERANPTGPVSKTVAREATVANALSLSKVSLIGVYGTSSQRRALVRLPSGKMVKVKVGDRIDGGRVAAIGSSDLQYQKSGRMLTLKMPKG